MNQVNWYSCTSSPWQNIFFIGCRARTPAVVAFGSVLSLVCEDCKFARRGLSLTLMERSQGLQGSAARYLRLLLASTAGYKHRGGAVEALALPGVHGRLSTACVPSTHGLVRVRRLLLARLSHHVCIDYFSVLTASTLPLALFVQVFWC